MKPEYREKNYHNSQQKRLNVTKRQRHVQIIIYIQKNIEGKGQAKINFPFTDPPFDPNTHAAFSTQVSKSLSSSGKDMKSNHFRSIIMLLSQSYHVVSEDF